MFRPRLSVSITGFSSFSTAPSPGLIPANSVLFIDKKNGQ